MASGSHYYTASEVGDLVTAEDEFLLTGSDDDFDAALDDDLDPLDREQGKNTCVINRRTTIFNNYAESFGPFSHNSDISHKPSTSPEPSATPDKPRVERQTHRRSRGCTHRGRSSSHRRQQHSSVSGEEEWSSTLTVEPFNQLTGPLFLSQQTQKSCFSSFFPPQLIDHIVVETNRYAAACHTSSHTGEGPVPEWSTNAEEIHRYLSFSVFMGINRLPHLYDYWSTSVTDYTISLWHLTYLKNGSWRFRGTSTS